MKQPIESGGAQRQPGRERPPAPSAAGSLADNRAGSRVQLRMNDAIGQSSKVASLQAIEARVNASPRMVAQRQQNLPPAQLQPLPVVSQGLTHLVHEQDESIFEGYEVDAIGQIQAGEKLVVDDEDIIVSRRGIHSEDDEDKHEQYRTGEQIYDWYHVMKVKDVDVSSEKLYVREETFAVDHDPEPLDVEDAQDDEARIVCDPYGDGDEEGVVIGEDVRSEKTGCELDMGDTVKTFDKYFSMDPPNAKVGDKVTITSFHKPFEGTLKSLGVVEKQMLVLQLDGSGEVTVEASKVRPKGGGRPAIKYQEQASITHMTRQAHPHGGEFVEPGGEIDITSHALGSGIYGFDTVSDTVEKYRATNNLIARTVTFDNPFVVQDRAHGAMLISFSKLLARTAKAINGAFDRDTELSMPLIQRLLLNDANYAALAGMLSKLLALAGQGAAPPNALGSALLDFFQKYRDPRRLFVEQVGTTLFRQMGFGGIAGTPDTGIDGLTTGNVAFVTDFVHSKIKTRSGTGHNYVT